MLRCRSSTGCCEREPGLGTAFFILTGGWDVIYYLGFPLETLASRYYRLHLGSSLVQPIGRYFLYVLGSHSMGQTH